MMFLVFLSLFLLASPRPQYEGRYYPRLAQGLVPYVDSADLVQEFRARRQPDQQQEQPDISNEVHGNNDAEDDFHFHEMPMKPFVQLEATEDTGAGKEQATQ